MEFHHVSVLREETIHAVLGDPAGIYVDCTLGGRRSQPCLGGFARKGWVDHRPLIRMKMLFGRRQSECRMHRVDLRRYNVIFAIWVRCLMI